MKSCLSRGFFLCFGLLMMLAGAGGAWQMTSDWIWSNASRDWPQTTGIIESRYAVARSGGRRGVDAGWDFNAAYRYQVRGKSYIGTRYDWSSIAKSKQQVARLYSAHPPNFLVPVFYDPNQPQRSCLVPDSFHRNSIYSSLIFCFGLLCLFLGALPQRAK